MSKQTSPWRVGPISAFDVHREPARHASAEAFSASRASTAGIPSETDVMRVLFAGRDEEQHPSFVLLVGQAGAGAGRFIPQLQQEHDDGLVALSTADLQAFHPRYADVAFRASLEGQRALAEASAAWVQAGLRYARERHHSLLLEGAFPSAGAALGVAGLFAQSGYNVHVAAVAVRGEESLLAATSTALRQIRERRPAALVHVREHAETFTGTRSILEAAETDPAVSHLSVIDRHGAVVFDAHRTAPTPIVGASRVLDAGRAERMTSLESAQWLGELRRATEFAQTLRPMPQPVREALVELHEQAVRRVLPELLVPAGSHMVQIQQARHAAALVELRHSTPPASGPDAAAPVVQPTPSTGTLER